MHETTCKLLGVCVFCRSTCIWRDGNGMKFGLGSRQKHRAHNVFRLHICIRSCSHSLSPCKKYICIYMHRHIHKEFFSLEWVRARIHAHSAVVKIAENNRPLFMHCLWRFWCAAKTSVSEISPHNRDLTLDWRFFIFTPSLFFPLFVSRKHFWAVLLMVTENTNLSLKRS